MWRRLARLAPYHAHFLGSMSHAWLALCTLGIGIGIASPLSVLVGLGAYGLGVLFLPELGPFKRRYDALREAEIKARLDEENSTKLALRASLLAKLSPAGKARREAFSKLCAELERKLGQAEASSLVEESSMTKVSDSHLLLLAMDAEVHAYLATAESAEKLSAKIQAIEADVQALAGRGSLSDVQQRLLVSKEETLRSLRQQRDQHERMRLNLELAQSELQRLESQLDALKAELISQPASQLSHRLGETLIQVEASQRVLKEGGMVAAPDLTTLLGERA